MNPQKVKTTFEMDGLLNQNDIDNRFSIFKQCRKCSKWTPTDSRKKDLKCSNCGGNEFDPRSSISARSFNPFNKRKVK